MKEKEFKNLMMCFEQDDESCTIAHRSVSGDCQIIKFYLDDRQLLISEATSWKELFEKEYAIRMYSFYEDEQREWQHLERDFPGVIHEMERLGFRLRKEER